MHNKIFIVSFSFLMTFINFVIGNVSEALYLLILCISIDYIAGTIQSIINKKWDWHQGFGGFIKKFCVLFVVVLGHVIDRLLNQNDVFKTLAIYLLIANEGLSIINNLKLLGITVPEQFAEALKKIGGKKDN